VNIAKKIEKGIDSEEVFFDFLVFGIIKIWENLKQRQSLNLFGFRW